MHRRRRIIMDKKNQIEYTKLGQERIICVSDLVSEIIRRFWLVIVAAIIFAALFGGYKYIKDSEVAAQSSKTSELKNMEKKLSDTELEEVNNILRVQDNLAQQQEYVENSVLMQINAYAESNITLQYYFEVQNGEDNFNLMNMYQSYVNNGSLAADLKMKGINLDVQYIGELISCTSDYDAANSSADIILPEDICSFDVKVIHANEEECRALAGAIKECMEEYHQKLEETVDEHQLALMDESYAEVVDKSLWTYKLDRVNSIVSMQERLETLQQDISDAQKAVIAEYTMRNEQENKSDDKVEEQENIAKVSISKKYVVVGGLGGIILACLYIIICYIMRGTINNSEDLQYLYNLRILGNIRKTDKINIFQSVWNTLLGKKTVLLSSEESKKLLLSNLRITCEKNNIKKFLISSSNCLQGDQEWLKSLIQELRKAGIEAEYDGNLPHSLSALEKLVQYDTVVFIEEIRVSRYEDIEKEIKLCMEQNIDILGIITFS